MKKPYITIKLVILIIVFVLLIFALYVICSTLSFYFEIKETEYEPIDVNWEISDSSSYKYQAEESSLGDLYWKRQIWAANQFSEPIENVSDAVIAAERVIDLRRRNEKPDGLDIQEACYFEHDKMWVVKYWPNANNDSNDNVTFIGSIGIVAIDENSGKILRVWIG